MWLRARSLDQDRETSKDRGAMDNSAEGDLVDTRNSENRLLLPLWDWGHRRHDVTPDAEVQAMMMPVLYHRNLAMNSPTTKV